jgi:hypothetical protein
VGEEEEEEEGGRCVAAPQSHLCYSQ